MSLRIRLIIAFCSLTLAAILMLSVTLNHVLQKDALTSFKQAAKEQITAQRENKKLTIKALMNDLGMQITYKSASQLIKQAALEFTQAFSETTSTATLDKSALNAFYQKDFNSNYYQLNDENPTRDPLQLMSNTAVYMQTAYIANNAFPLGEKNKLVKSDLSLPYDDVHLFYHKELNHYLSNFGYYDIFIVDAKTSDIVYSVFKEIDFATNLKTGPFKNSNLAEAFNKGLKLAEGESYITDFSPYFPSYNSPASFISSPVFNNNELTAILIYQFPIERINNIMTNWSQWLASGYGQSGETYLVGSDGKLLSESRFFVEDKQGYIDLLTQTDQKDVADIVKKKSTSIGVQNVDSVGVKNALKGETGFAEIIDYRNIPVYSAYTSIDIGHGVRWAILSEVDTEEALKWVTILEDNQLESTFYVALLSMIITALLAVSAGKKLVSPINSIANRFTDISSGDGDLTQRIRRQDSSELQKVGSGFNDFLDQIEGIIEQVQISSNSLNNLSTRLSDSAKKSSSNTANQKDSTFMVSSAMEQYNQSFLEVAKNTEDASTEANEASVEANNSAQASRDASSKINLLVENLSNSSNAVKQLESEVDAIKNVLSTITSIADQTNLLALNAAIEAARAGEQGRGFAVVADEVRTLAGRTQKTTIEIQHKMDELQKAAQFTVKSISDSSSHAKEGSETVANVAERLDVLSSKVKGVQDRTNTIATATTEQLATSKEINHQLEMIDGISEDITQTAKDVANAVDQINAISTGISILMERFKVSQHH